MKSKVVCGCCGRKIQRKRSTNHADWYFFTCITKNCQGAVNVRGEIHKEALRTALDVAHEAKAALAEVMEQKAACEKGYRIFRRLLSASDKRITLSEIINYIDQVVVDNGKEIVVKWIEM